MFDLDEAESYLDRRFSGLRGYLAMAVKFSQSGWTEHQYKWPDEKGRTIRNVRDLVGSDIYICPTLRKDEGRDKWNGLASRTVFADLDGGKIPTLLSSCTELVNSGTAGHYHAYVTLTEPVSVERIEALNYALAKVSNGDSKWANNTVLRLPGTFNYKDRTKPKLVKLEQLASNVVEASNLESFMSEHMPKFSISYPTEAELGELHLVGIPSNLNPYIKQRLIESADGDRSDKSYHFILACIEKGLSKNLIYSLAHKHQPTMAKYGGRHDGIKHQVLAVMNYHGKKSVQPLFQDVRQWL